MIFSARTIKILWSAFHAVFSMEHIRRSFAKESVLCLVGDPDKTAAFESLLKKGGFAEPPEMDLEKRNINLEAKAQKEDVVRFIHFPYPPACEHIASLKEATAIFILIPVSSVADRKVLADVRNILPQRLPRLWILEGNLDAKLRLETELQWIEMGLGYLVWEKGGNVPAAILNLLPEKSNALALHLPYLREEKVTQLIKETSIQNMIVALVSALPGNIPVVGPVLELMAVAGDSIFITANQLRMCLEIAGIYGNELNFLTRMRVLWPLVGGAIGWRTLARTIAGFAPIAGFAAKGILAFAGTVLAGETARWYYRQGRTLSPDERRSIYANAKLRAIDAMLEFLESLKSPPARDTSSLTEDERARVIDEAVRILKESRLPPTPPEERDGPQAEENTGLQ